MLIFVSGGVRSGKSSFAEQMASKIVDHGDGLHYIATSIRYDYEMDKRIKKHQEDRKRNALEWRTWEQPTNLQILIDEFTKKDVVLIDCLTTLLGNELFSDDCWQDDHAIKRLYQRLIETFEAFKQDTKATIIVSNEVFNSGVPKDKGSFLYMKMLGSIHQVLSEMADQAFLVECGIPQLMKEGLS